MTNLYITLLLAFMATALYVLYRNDSRKARNGRGNIFNDCSTLLTEVSNTQEKIGFPTLRGGYNGYQVMLEAQVDTLSMRKVPPLWLTITVIGKQLSHGTLDVLVRPQNTEFYSPGWDWNYTLSVPQDWPQHAIVKHQGTVAPIDMLEDLIPALLTDEKVKELLITPAVVRITYLAKQAERGEYMLMRNAVFDGLPIGRDAVAALLQSATEIRNKLEGAI